MTGRTVIIVHPSELMCRGLAAVLEDLKTVRIRCYSSFSEIRVSELDISNKLLMYVPASCRFTDELRDIRARIGEHYVVGLMHANEEEIQKEVFDQVVAVEAPANVFLKIAEEFFDQEEGEHTDELTNREREVLRLVALGHSNKMIAENLFISTHTVISHRKNITEKLGIKSIPGLTVYAIIQKLIDPSDISDEQLL